MNANHHKDVLLTLKWSDQDFPQKVDKALELRIQSWLHKNAKNSDCEVVKILRDRNAVIRITSAPGVV